MHLSCVPFLARLPQTMRRYNSKNAGAQLHA